MSKTSQRKTSLYSMGYQDGLHGREFYWARHPQKDHYHFGYLEGQRVRRERQGKHKYPRLRRFILSITRRVV